MAFSTEFNGFPEECLKFYRDLRHNNNTNWFEAHRSDYELFVLKPAREFVSAMGERLLTLVPDITAIPKINKSLFKIHRDIRFTQDKTPYKTHLAFLFWEGGAPRMENSGFYFHIDPHEIMIAAGLYSFPRKLLQRYRESVVDPRYAPRLKEAAVQVGNAGYDIGIKHYKRIPKGYDPNHMNSEYLLYSGLVAFHTEPVPDILFSPEFLEYCFSHFAKMKPIHDWLRETVATE